MVEQTLQSFYRGAWLTICCAHLAGHPITERGLGGVSRARCRVEAIPASVCAQQFEHLVRDVLAGAGCDTDAIGGDACGGLGCGVIHRPDRLDVAPCLLQQLHDARVSDGAAGPSPAPLLVSSAGTASGAGGVALMTTSASNSVEEALA